MKKIIVVSLILSTWMLAGFFPPKVNSVIKSVDGKSATLGKAFPVNGMTGIVIHSFGKNLKAITAIATQTSPAKVKLEKGDLLEHDGLPTPKSLAVTGDRVIGGYLYSNVLVLAPNRETYEKITKSASRNWIHPDLFAAYLTREGDSRATKKNLAGFAKEAQVGLIYIVQKGQAVLLDPISGKVVGKKSFQATGSGAKYPFYNRFDKVGGGLFSLGSSKGDYYEEIGKIH